jgi:hypothetical protein
MIQVPSKMDINLPDILKSVKIVWSEESSNGNTEGEWIGSAEGDNWTLQGTESSSASGSGSLRPQLIMDVERLWGSDVPITVHAFFLKMKNNIVKEADILAKLNVLKWPVFRPQTQTITCKGARATVRVSVSGSASKRVSGTVEKMTETGTSRGVDVDVNLLMDYVPIPFSLHGALSFGEITKTTKIQAAAVASWKGTNFPSIRVTSEKDYTITGSVTPSSIAATSPPDIPRSGKYLMRSTVEPYNWGYAKCTAIVLDASVFR